jgi:hypothetical protein
MLPQHTVQSTTIDTFRAQLTVHPLGLTRFTALFYYYPAYTLLPTLLTFIVKSLITTLQNEVLRILSGVKRN